LLNTESMSEAHFFGSIYIGPTLCEDFTNSVNSILIHVKLIGFWHSSFAINVEILSYWKNRGCC